MTNEKRKYEEEILKAKDLYTHKIEMYLGNREDLVFLCALYDEKSSEEFFLIDVPIFKKDELTIDLFNEVIEGRLEMNFHCVDGEDKNIIINEGSALRNIDRYMELQEEFFCAKIKKEVIK